MPTAEYDLTDLITTDADSVGRVSLGPEFKDKKVAVLVLETSEKDDSGDGDE